MSSVNVNTQTGAFRCITSPQRWDWIESSWERVLPRLKGKSKTDLNFDSTRSSPLAGRWRHTELADAILGLASLTCSRDETLLAPTRPPSPTDTSSYRHSVGDRCTVKLKLQVAPRSGRLPAFQNKSFFFCTAGRRQQSAMASPSGGFVYCYMKRLLQMRLWDLMKRLLIELLSKILQPNLFLTNTKLFHTNR